MCAGLLVTLACLGLSATSAYAEKPPPPRVMPTVKVDVCPLTSADTSGCYSPDLNEAWVTDPYDRFMLAHEIGHAFDAQYLDGGERHRFAHLVDRVGPWLPETYGFEGDHDFAGEDFADTYAACAMGYREVDRGLCRFIRRAAL